MDEVMTTTTFTLEGYRIVESLAVVRGVTMRSRSLLGTIGAKFETLIGGHITFTSLCEPAPAPTRSTSCWPMRSGAAPTRSWGSATTRPRSCRA